MVQGKQNPVPGFLSQESLIDRSAVERCSIILHQAEAEFSVSVRVDSESYGLLSGQRLLLHINSLYH